MSCRSGGGYCKARREEVWIDKDIMIQRSALNRGWGSASVARERGKRVGGRWDRCCVSTPPGNKRLCQAICSVGNPNRLEWPVGRRRLEGLEIPGCVTGSIACKRAGFCTVAAAVSYVQCTHHLKPGFVYGSVQLNLICSSQPRKP